MQFETLTLDQIYKEGAKLINVSNDRIGKEYAKIVYEIRTKLADVYKRYGNEDGTITYANLTKNGRLDKLNKTVETIIKTQTKPVTSEIQKCLRKSLVSSHELTKLAVEQQTQRKIKGILKPETIDAIIQTPISGLNLNERLAKNQVLTVISIKEELNRGLVQGKRYKDIAKQIEERTQIETEKAIRLVRTESHRCLETGKHESIKHAANQGVELRKWWKNGDDERVRPDHVYLGTKYSKENAIPFDEDFINEKTGGKGPHPGAMGVAADDVNCRCTMIIEIVVPKEKELEKNVKPITKEDLSETFFNNLPAQTKEASMLGDSNLKIENNILKEKTRTLKKMQWNDLYNPEGDTNNTELINAYTYYKEHGYFEMNEYMRYGEEKLLSRGIEKQKINYIDKYCNILETTIKTKGTKIEKGTILYRGLGENAGLKALNLKINDPFEDKAFQSFSIYPEKASPFAKNVAKGSKIKETENVIIKAIAGGNEKGIAGTDYESEIIISPDTKWKVIKKERILPESGKGPRYTVITIIGET